MQVSDWLAVTSCLDPLGSIAAVKRENDRTCKGLNKKKRGKEGSCSKKSNTDIKGSIRGKSEEERELGGEGIGMRL